MKPRPPINTARKLAEARAHLGIGKIAMAAALRLKGDKAYQTIRRMEAGTCPVPGPVQVAVEAMLGHAGPRAQDPTE